MNRISTEALDRLLQDRNTAVVRDLKLNLKRVLEESALDPLESLPSLLAAATSTGQASLAAFAREELVAREVPPEQIQEAAESAAIVGMLNMYYRFRHMVAKPDDYATAGLRMTSLAKPALGKERFEMASLVVSVLNGCETCIKAHEKVLRDGGVSADKVHDLVRLAATVKGLEALANV